MKEWYKSRSIWVSVAALISAVAMSVGLQLTPDQTQVLLFGILGLLGISLRKAID